jgi:hypothetical protein
MSERMFDPTSFNDLQDVSEVKSAVVYLAYNESKFRQELASEGMDYDDIQKEVARIWTNLLKLCSKYKYSDYIVQSKKQIYGVK